MSDEKLRVLEMIKDGTLTPDEGLQILNAIEEGNKPMLPVVAHVSENSQDKTGAPSDEKPSGTGKKPRWLCIHVDDAESGKKVDIKLPIAFAKAAGKFIPKEAQTRMAEKGIDLDIQSILSMLDSEGLENLIEVTDGDKKIVKICTE
jgi:hypothetical protein